MIVASSSAARVGVPASGPWAAHAASQPVKRRLAPEGASGNAMQGSSSGIPGSIDAQSSSLPTNSSEAPLWASSSRTEVPVTELMAERVLGLPYYSELPTADIVEVAERLVAAVASRLCEPG